MLCLLPHWFPGWLWFNSRSCLKIKEQQGGQGKTVLIKAFDKGPIYRTSFEPACHPFKDLVIWAGCKMGHDGTPPYTPEILNNTKVSGCKIGRGGLFEEKQAFVSNSLGKSDIKITSDLS